MSIRLLLSCCALTLLMANVANAQPSELTADCANFGTGCENLIPETGNGPDDMVPSIIIVPPDLFGCAGTSGLVDVDVSIEITHTWRGDLEVFIEHEPSGTMVELFTDIDGSSDDINATFDDQADGAIDGPPCNATGSACEGTFRPEGMLADFNGIDPSGLWRLHVTDDASGDSGQLVSWSLRFLFADDDGDGIADCGDDCPNDPNKTSPGVCGCGEPDDDTDNDGLADCVDPCPEDVDSDNDGVDDCLDGCPDDPAKLMPGACGCGVADEDADNDGTADCNDDCPNDPNKSDAGLCGCGQPDVDSDGDGWLDCLDNCPNLPNADQADANEDGIGDACTEEPAGQGAPCAQGLLLTPMMLTMLVWRRRRRR